MKNNVLDKQVSIVTTSQSMSLDFIYREPLIKNWLSVDFDPTLNQAVRSNLLPFGEELIVALAEAQSSEEQKQKFLDLLQSGKQVKKPISYEALDSLGYTFNHSKTAFENICNSLKKKLFK